MCPRRGGTGDRLPVDVAEVGHGEIEVVEDRVEAGQRDNALYRDEAGGAVGGQHAGQPVQVHQCPVGDAGCGERVTGTDGLDPRAVRTRPLDEKRYLLDVSRVLDRAWVRLLVARPVLPVRTHRLIL